MQQRIASKHRSTGYGLSHLTIDVHRSQLHLIIEASEALAAYSYKPKPHGADLLQMKTCRQVCKNIVHSNQSTKTKGRNLS